MFKKANVVMLPTNEKANIAKYNNTLYNTIKDKDYSQCYYQHFYITSDEEIKKGDWYYDCECKVKAKICRLADDELPMSYDRKIIASTNPSLNLPQPSPQFIQKYIEEYNKGNIITEVMVEYEVNSKDIIKFGARGEHVKVNSKDNTITIKKIKDSWTREEVVKLIKEYHASFASYPTMNLDLRDNWISKNL